MFLQRLHGGWEAPDEKWGAVLRRKAEQELCSPCKVGFHLEVLAKNLGLYLIQELKPEILLSSVGRAQTWFSDRTLFDLGLFCGVWSSVYIFK